MSDDHRSNHVGGSNEDIHVSSLNFEIEELDDSEYQIPEIIEPPTLESILNDPEDRLSVNEDNDSLNWSHCAQSAPGLCLEGSSETLSLASQRSRSSSDKKGTASTAYLRHVLLKGISTQVTSAADRVNAGSATAITVTNMVAVGTSHGLILVFDSRQTLKWCLSSPDSDQGSVSSLCFNSDSTRLLVGFARGHILMFDITNGKLIRTLTDAHPPGTAVLSVKFTDSPSVALCSDSGGSVFELNFKRILGVRGCDSKCLFSGSRGEVCVIQPLLLNQLMSHPLQGVILVAMATLSKVIVVSIRPKMKVILVRALPAGSTVLPLISWQLAVIEMGGSGKVIDPVLAYAKDNSINFFQVSVDSELKLRVAALQRLVLNYSLLSLHWLNSCTIAAIDLSERLHLLNVHTHEELESLDTSNIGMVYETSHFKGILTGGNVSRAMALSGERACYNTIVSYGNQILILGRKTVHVLSIRPWTERLNYLVKQKKYFAALSLGLSFYEDPKAAFGLKGSRERKQEITKMKVIQILEQFIDNMENPLEDIPACVQYAAAIHHPEIIFTKLWDNVFLDRTSKVIYLESLEPLILNDQLCSIPPAILQNFVYCYEQSGKLQALEACIIHLDISSLDLHQVVQICWTYGFYDAIIYVHNKALNDYTTPIHELVPIIQQALSTGRELSGKEVELGNKLLVYVSCCLAGRGYPIGDVPRDSVQTVKYEMFKCLTSLHSKNSDDSELPYPYLRALIHFDTREFLNVVSLAFTEPEFTSELGLRQRQRLVDILLQIMVHTPGFSASEVGALFTFLARQLGRPHSGLQVDKELFHKVFEYLTEPNGTHREERQQALLELLRAGGLQEYSKDTLLELARKAKFFRVCEVIYEQNGEWDEVFLCYLQDPVRKPQVFSFLRNIFLLYPNIKEIQSVLDQVCEKIEELMELDIESTSIIVSAHFMERLSELLDNMKNNEKLQLALLKSVLYSKTKELIFEDESLLPIKYLDNYMQLVLKIEPKYATEALRTYADLYDIDRMLNIVKDSGHLEALVFLLERKQDFYSAYQIMNEELLNLMSQGESSAQSKLEHTVMELVGIVQRSRNVCGETQRDELWCSLLDNLIKCQYRMEQKEKTRLISLILGGTVGHANPSAILEFLLHHPAYSGATFGEIRQLLTGMLENTWYEEQLVTTTQKLVCSDLHSQLVYLLKGAKRGVRPQSTLCSVCNKPLGKVPFVISPGGEPTHKSCISGLQDPTSSSIALEKAESKRLEKHVPTETSLNSNSLIGNQLTLKVTARPAPDLENLFNYDFLEN